MERDLSSDKFLKYRPRDKAEFCDSIFSKVFGNFSKEKNDK